MPTAYENLALWLDASDTSTLFQDSDRKTPLTEARQSVAVWLDKGPLGNHATQMLERRMPSFFPNAADGNAALTFNGDGQHLDVDSFGTNFEGESWTAFFMVRAVSASKAGTVLAATTNPRAYGRAFRHTETCREKRCVEFTSKSRSREGVDSNYAASAQWELWEVVNRQGALELLVNGDLKGADRFTPGAMENFSRTAVGGWPRSAGATSTWEGFIGEIVFYATALEDSQRKTVREYVAKKWSVDLDG